MFKNTSDKKVKKVYISICFLIGIFFILPVLFLEGCGKKEEIAEPIPVELAKDVSTVEMPDTDNVYKGIIEKKEYYIAKNRSDKNYAIRTFKCPADIESDGIVAYYSKDDAHPRVVDYETYKSTWNYYTLSWLDTNEDVRADIGWEYKDESSNYIIYVDIDNINRFATPQEPILNDYIRNDYKVDIYIQGDKTVSDKSYGDGYILVIPTDLNPGEGRFNVIRTITEQTWESLVDDAKTNPDEERAKERKE